MKRSGVLGRVTVENGLGHFLTHGFDEGTVFADAEGGGVAVDVGQILIDFGVGFEVAARVGHLSRGALSGLYAAVELAPRRGGKAGTDRVQIAVRLVAFNKSQVVENRELLIEDFRDRSDSTRVVKARHEVGERRVLASQNCHMSPLVHVRVVVKVR